MTVGDDPFTKRTRRTSPKLPAPTGASSPVSSSSTHTGTARPHLSLEATNYKPNATSCKPSSTVIPTKTTRRERRNSDVLSSNNNIKQWSGARRRATAWDDPSLRVPVEREVDRAVDVHREMVAGTHPAAVEFRRLAARYERSAAA